MKAIAYCALLMFAISLGACTYDSLDTPSTCLTPFELEIVSTSASSCGLAIGNLEVRLVESIPELELLQFSIDDGQTFQAAGLFENVSAGSYVVQATNGNCTAEIIVAVENEEGLNASLNMTPSSCGSPTGRIQLEVSDQEGAVSYSLNGSPPQSAPLFEQLAPGAYTLTISDESGCEIVLESTVFSDVEFADVDAIVQSNCAVSGCHNGNVSPDFRDDANIKSRASRIQSRTTARSMPPPSSGRSLNQEQIEAIACWVSDGAPQ